MDILLLIVDIARTLAHFVNFVCKKLLLISHSMQQNQSHTQSEKYVLFYSFLSTFINRLIFAGRILWKNKTNFFFDTLRHIKIKFNEPKFASNGIEFAIYQTCMCYCRHLLFFCFVCSESKKYRLLSW